MKIIDFTKTSNCVKFFLGADDCDDYHGDDWNDTPYEDNAGKVYDRYVLGTRTIYFDIEDVILEPSDSWGTSCLSMNDLKERKSPCCIVVLSQALEGKEGHITFNDWVNYKGAIKYYLGDNMEPGVAYHTNDINLIFPPK